MDELKQTGGAEIGLFRMTWPFAKLTVNKGMLKLSCSIAGTFYFTPSDIISIEPYGLLFKSGIKINHTVDKYNSKIIFTSTQATSLINEIRQTGFLDNKASAPGRDVVEIAKIRDGGSFPFKIPAVIFIAVVWNALFLSDWLSFSKNKGHLPLGIGAQLALAFILATSILILTFKPVRQLVMKDGRSVDDIKVFLYFMIFIAFLMSLILLIVPN